ncbi:MAG: histidine kinase [Anaerolineaceae bacterium]|nr:MAG: histidine kinase [Anaerolineaceae bacterium]
MRIPSIAHPNARFRFFARVGSAAVILVGCLALMGWIFDITVLKSLLPGAVTMKANTAVCFLLAGASLWLALSNTTDRRIQRLKQACAVIVALIGLLTLSEYLFGWNLGIDQLLFKESAGAVGTSHPGRMAPNTALNFLLIGFGLLFLDWETRAGHYPAQVFIIPAGVIAMLGLLGYAYGVRVLYGFFNYTPMAVNTAAAFTILCLSILFARPTNGLMANISSPGMGGLLARRLLLIAFIVPAALGWMRLLGEQAGLYDTPFGTSLMVIANTAIFVIMILSTARLLNKTDAALQQANADLEKRVIKRTAELTASERNFRDLADSALFGVYRTTLKGEILYVNETLARVLGFDSPEELMRGGALARYRDPQDRQTFLERMQRDGKVETFETVLLTRDGQPRNILMSAALHSDQMIGNLMDITERKQAEIDVRKKSEQLLLLSTELEIIIDSIPGLVFYKDTNNHFIRVNKYMSDAYNMSKKQLEGANLFDLHSREEAQAYFEDDLQVIRSRQSKLNIDEPWNTETGARWINTSKIPFINETGEVMGVIGISMDVTERKRAEAVLSASESRFRRLFEAARDGILILDHETGMVVDVNPFLIEMLGYSREQFLGKRIWEIGFFKDIAANKSNFTELQQKEFIQYENLPLETAAGNLINVEFVSHVYQIDDKKVIQCNIRDITERMKMEEERLARETAERANQAKSEFLSRMSHELRTPLNAILGFAQLLEMDELTPDQTDSLGQILKSGRHLLDLINEVLDIARIEAGHIQISPEPVQLDEAIESAADLIRPLAEKRGISIQIKVPSSRDVFITADRQRLKQVLLNLLSNAVKYNCEGGQIHVTASLLVDGYLHLAVKDTGNGIPPEKMERLFVAFDRLELDPGLVEGTGLGLALSKGLVEAMGGRIGAQSVVGEGSTFWLDLQLTSNQKEAIVMAEVDDYLNSNSGLKKGLVLYVEDNLSNIQLIEKILAHLSADVELISAMQGRLAMTLARQHKPALILLDLHLPDIHGSDVLQWLRAEPETKDIPVVVMSADATQRQIEKMLAAGANAYLTKPIDVKEFLKMIGEILGSKDI